MSDAHHPRPQYGGATENAYGIKAASHEVMWQGFLKGAKIGTIIVCITIALVMAVLTLGGS